MRPGLLETVFSRREEALDGFLGAAYAMHHVAAFTSMCEPQDVGRAVGDGEGRWFATVGANGRGQIRRPDGAEMDAESAQHFCPALFLYDNYPGGIGLSAPLYDARQQIVRQSRALILACGCRCGCPACIGPILASDETRGFSPREAAVKVLDLLSHEVA